MRTIFFDIQSLIKASYPNRKISLQLINKLGEAIAPKIEAMTDANSQAVIEVAESESGYMERRYLLSFDTTAISPITLYVPDGTGELDASLCLVEWKSKKVEDFVRMQRDDVVCDEGLLHRIDSAWVDDIIGAYDAIIKAEFERYADYKDKVRIWEYQVMDEALYAMYEACELPKEVVNG